MSMFDPAAPPWSAANGVGVAARAYNQDSGKVRGTAGTWALTVFCCLFVVASGITLYYSTTRFNDLYDSVNMPTTGLSWFVFHCYRWFYPIFFGGSSALVITKEFFVRRKWMNVAITLAVIAAVHVAGLFIVFALYAPVKLFGDPLR